MTEHCESCGIRDRIAESTTYYSVGESVPYCWVTTCPMADACAYVDSVEQPTSRLPVVAHAGE